MSANERTVRRRRARTAAAGTLLILVPLLGANAAGQTAEPDRAAAAAMPAALQGLWGPVRDGVAEDCENRTGHDYKGFVTISRDRVEYWEEQGTPTRVRRVSANRYDVDLDNMNSDAATWKQRTTFTLSGGNRMLTVAVAAVSDGAREPEEVQRYGPLTAGDLPEAGSRRSYARCPAGARASS